MPSLPSGNDTLRRLRADCVKSWLVREKEQQRSSACRQKTPTEDKQVEFCSRLKSCRTVSVPGLHVSIGGQ